MALSVESGLEELPDELIIRIFSWLPIFDLLRVYEIPNRRVKNLAVDKALLLNFRNLNFSRGYNQDHETIAKVMKTFGRSDITSSLSIENCYQLKVSQVVRPLISLSGLQVLDLTSVHVTPVSLAKVLNGLTSLEALGLTGPNTVLIDEELNPVEPFTEQTMEALKRLKHLKVTVSYDGMETNIFSCFHNMETLMLDFMTSHKDLFNCICDLILEEDFDNLDKLQVVFSPRNGMKMAGITCWGHCVNHFQNFQPITWKTKHGICFESYNITEAGFSEHGSYEPSWTALVRDYSEEIGLSETSESPFFKLPCEDDLKPAENFVDKYELITSDVTAVSAMRFCCVPPEERFSAFHGLQKYTHLEELDVFCLSDLFFEGAVTDENHAPPSENDDERRGLFKGLLQLIEQAPHLWRFSLTVPSRKVTMRIFLSDLPEKCRQLQSLSLSFPTKWPHLQLSPHLSAALPKMKQLRDLRIDSSHFQFNPQFAWSLQQCPVLTRLCILTKSGSCSACQSLPAVFNSCKDLIFVCLDGFSHDPCSKRQAQQVKTTIKNRYLASRPALFITFSLEGKHCVPEVHFAEMVRNRWGQRL